MSIQETYQKALDDDIIQPDDKQKQVVEYLSKMEKNLLERKEERSGILGKIRRSIKPRRAVKGIYLWGPVGSGKTFLVDLFYHHINLPKKRIHFHEFMQDVHEELNQPEIKNQSNPLELIAKRFTEKFQLLCLDEMLVYDIADAMIFKELFIALFENGLCLMTTSNTEPDQLYKRGLQREQFIPAIKVLKKNTNVMTLNNDKDYRLSHMESAGLYYTPLDQEAEHHLEQSFSHFARHIPTEQDNITIAHRDIKTRGHNNRVIWFDFQEICAPPRAAADYLSISENFHTVIISNVPQFGPKDTVAVTLFTKLIDILYDNHIRLVVSAETSIDTLYPEGRLTEAFQRTQSRLVEMGTTTYNLKEHALEDKA